MIFVKNHIPFTIIIFFYLTKISYTNVAIPINLWVNLFLKKKRKIQGNIIYGVILEVYLMLLLCPSKNELLLKLQFDQNSIVINHKLDGNFKSHIIIRRT
jgi:hypothetical protein